MEIEIKWTPWRGSYVKSAESDPGCPMCNAFHAQNDRDKLVLYRGAHVFVMMNLYPYNPGHLLIAPNEHTADFINLPTPVASELMLLGQRAMAIISEVMHPQGFNAGFNLGKVSGGSVDQHLHFHVVPRWNGDLNFMPLIGGVKTVPEAIDDTYDALRPHFDALQGNDER